jgi:hypothetical protein
LTEAMIVDHLQDLKDETPEDQRWCIFRKIGQLIDARRRLVETEVRHMVLAREMMTAEEAMTLVRAIVEVVTLRWPRRSASWWTWIPRFRSQGMQQCGCLTRNHDVPNCAIAGDSVRHVGLVNAVVALRWV